MEDASAPTRRPRRQAGFWLALAYAAPVLPYSMLATPALSIVPPIYAKHGSLTLAAVSIALLIARTFDALVDPLIGVLSDKTRRYIGRRLWIHTAILLTAVAASFWLNVGEDASFAYFLGWSTCLCLAWSMFEIPHRALLAEIIDDPKMQARLAAWRTGMSRMGVLACLLVLQHAGETPLVTPHTLAVLAIIVVPLLVITGVIFHLGTAGIEWGASRLKAPALRLGFWIEFLARKTASRRLLQASLLQGIAAGMTSALYFLYMDTLLGIAQHIPMIAFIAGIVGLVSAWAWVPIIDRIGNAHVLMIGNIGLTAALLMFCLVAPGEHATRFVMTIFIVSALVATGVEISMVLLATRIILDHQSRCGLNLGASFFSLERFASQLGMAVGAAVSLFWIGISGFSISESNSRPVWAMFLISFSIIPAVLHVMVAMMANRLRELERPAD